MTVLEFTEWDRPRVVSLSIQEAERAQRYKAALRVEYVGGQKYRLGPGAGYVGSVVLSRFVSVVIQPRQPIGSFSTLLSLAYQDRRLPSLHGVASLGSSSITAWFMAQFCLEAERLIYGRVRRDYVPQADVMVVPRGRIMFDGRSPTITGSHLCVADDFILDTEANRLVKAGIVRALRYAESAFWRAKLKSILHHLDGISVVAPSINAVNRVLQYSRYVDYSSFMRLLLLLLRTQGTEFASGENYVSAFFFKTFDLFELALFNSIRTFLGASYAVSRRIDSLSAQYVSGLPNLGIRFRPDVLVRAGRPTLAIRASRADAWLAVVDAKYTRPTPMGRFGKTFINDNVYQILAYGKVFGCPGILVYPRVDEDVDIIYKVGDSVFRIITVDLRGNVAVEFQRVAAAILATGLEHSDR